MPKTSFNRYPGRLLALFLCIVAMFQMVGLESCCSKKDSISALTRKIIRKTENTAGTFAVAFKDLQDSSRSIFINEKVMFHAASTMKTPVLYELFKQAKAGYLSLNDSLTVVNQFRSILDSSLYQMSLSDDSGEKFYAFIGQKASIYDLAYDMITRSSNLATNILIEKVGAVNVTKSMQDIGAKDIRVLRGVEDLKAYEAGLSNTTDAFDLLILFEKLGNFELVDSVASKAMIDILADQQFGEIIPAQLPKEIIVAHKTGEITKILHDSALVILADGRKYVLVLLSKDWDTKEKARETMADISGLIYQFMK